jgi:hypothetical protein
MFSFTFSLRCGSGDPKMMRWTLLNMRRHFVKASEFRLLERSWRYVWKNQKVWGRH